MKSTRIVGSVIAVTLLALSACSDSDKPNEPVPQNDGNPLNDSTKIDQAIEEFLALDAVVGLSVALLKNTDDDTLMWTSEYGLRDIDAGTPVNPDTSFWIGSVSKAVMGVNLMIANERGFLQLDEDIHGILDSSGVLSLDNPEKQPVSIANLGSHSSGIVDGASYACAYFVPTGDGNHEKLVNLFDVGITCPEDSAVSLSGFLASYLDSDGEFYSAQDNFTQQPPGSDYEYSNIGAALAGYLVELTTGQDLATYAKQEVFTPLQMTNTSWRSAELDGNNIATAYILDDELIPLPRYELATWPDGGLRTNAADLANLLSVVLNDGIQISTGERLLSEDSLSKMLPKADAEVGLFWEQGESVMIDGEERSLIGHTGSDPGAFSLMFYDPISETGVIAVGNGDDDGITASDFGQLIESMFDSAGKLQ